MGRIRNGRGESRVKREKKTQLRGLEHSQGDKTASSSKDPALGMNLVYGPNPPVEQGASGSAGMRPQFSSSPTQGIGTNSATIGLYP